MQHKIALIVVYLDRIPPYFDVWLKSCAANREITFLFFTNQDLKHTALPANVKPHNITLEEVNGRLKGLFCGNYNINRAYKLCDLRPFYGELFAEELKNYDFWGHCDVDVVFGRISHFVTDGILDSYDKILTLGHFTLYRNTPEINSVYRRLDVRGRYRDVLSTDENCFFDEGIFKQIIPIYRQKHLFPVWLYDDRYNVNSIFASNGIPCYVNFDIIADINYYEDNLQCVWGSCADYRDRHARHSVFAWNEGRLVRYYLDRGVVKEEEFMYIHLQKRAMEVNVNVSEVPSFLILKHSFERMVPISEDFLRAANVNCRDFKAYKALVWRFFKHNGHRIKMVLKGKAEP